MGDQGAADVVHINAGLHDLKLTGTRYQVPLVEYEKNLKTILERIRSGTKAKIIFATSTPILDGLHAQRKAGFDRFEADVQKYNNAAVGVLNPAGVPINQPPPQGKDPGQGQHKAGPRDPSQP